MRCRHATGVVKLKDVDELCPDESDDQLDSGCAYAVSAQTFHKLKNDHLVLACKCQAVSPAGLVGKRPYRLQLALPHFEYGFEPVLDDGGSDFGALIDDDRAAEEP